MSIIGPDRFTDAAEVALAAGGDEIFVTAFHSVGGLTRFASSQIHQNTWREDVTIGVMAVVDGNKVGVAYGPSLEPDAVRKAAADALAIARVTPPDPAFPGLAPPAEYGQHDLHDEQTAAASPADRAAIVARALDEFPKDMDGAGYVETTENEVYLASTAGVRAYTRATQAGFSVMAMSPTSSGFAEMVERRLSAFDPQALAERAVRKAELGRDPRPIEPGAYTVVLEPAATATLLQFLSYLGFGAKAFLEGRSFLSGRIGERIMSDRITIVDDPTAPDALGLPFDFEGVPTRPTTLIERGVARDVVWDRTYARKAGRESTGHALPPPNTEGPLPINLRMLPGDESLDQLIGGTERGLLVTRFHYTNVVNEKETVLTGMTRDGTFLIEDGKLAHGVRNLRFTQNAVEALNNVEGIGDVSEISTELFFGGSRAPATKIANFKFSSATSH